MAGLVTEIRAEEAIAASATVDAEVGIPRLATSEEV